MSPRCIVWVFCAVVWAASGAFALAGCVGSPPAVCVEQGDC